MGYSPWSHKESDITEHVCMLLKLTSGFIWVHHYTFHRDTPPNLQLFKLIIENTRNIKYIKYDDKKSLIRDFPGSPVIKNLPSNARDTSWSGN